MTYVKHPIRPGDGDPRHGTLTGYTNHRCACDECREAHRVYSLELRRFRGAPAKKRRTA